MPLKQAATTDPSDSGDTTAEEDWASIYVYAFALPDSV